jgi:acyl-CoA synthetase (AMP-forming)/AMP-acid ligase II
MSLNFTKKILDQVDRFPDKQILKILLEGNYTYLTYKDIYDGARRFEYALKEAGIGSGEVVILILPHGLDLIFAYFGAIINGSIPSIMPSLTEKLIPEKYRKDFKSLIEISKPAALITFSDFKEEIKFLETYESSLKSVIISNKIDLNHDSDTDLLDHTGLMRFDDDIALLQHSSGTTGLQKGVALSHQSVINQLESYQMALKINNDDVIVSWLPLYHDMGLIAGFLLPLLYGIPLVLMSPFDWVKAPYKLMQAISKYKGTLCWLPNFAYNFCAKKIRDRDLSDVDLSSLRAVINCSEPMRFSSHEMFLNRFRKYGLQEKAIATSYAMAENVFAVTQGGIDQPITYDEIDLISFQEKNIAIPVRRDDRSVVMVSAGKPISNVEVKIIDLMGKYLHERQIGEIVIRSNCMLSGYYNRDEVTSESFIKGWFKTGDFGYIADSEIYISGRKKDLIIVGGKNIYPKDLETIAMEIEGVHPGRVVAFGVYNEIKGTEDVVIIAEIESESMDKKESIIEDIRRKVTRESAIALRNILLVEKKWLIKTSSGKIARALNKKKYIKEILS